MNQKSYMRNILVSWTVVSIDGACGLVMHTLERARGTPGHQPAFAPNNKSQLGARRAAKRPLHSVGAEDGFSGNFLFQDQLRRGLFPLESPLQLTRDGVGIFENQFDGIQGTPGNKLDQAYLSNIPISESMQGPMEIPLKPFTCLLKKSRRKRKKEVSAKTLTAREILVSLQAKHFRSDHIPSLDATDLPYTGYKPGTWNDEIHTSDADQKLFSSEESVKDWMELTCNECPREYETELLLDFLNSLEGFQRLKLLVQDEKLWYVLLHCGPDETILQSENRLPKGNMVVLFAVGISRASGNIVGFVTEQACHNYCD